MVRFSDPYIDYVDFILGARVQWRFNDLIRALVDSHVQLLDQALAGRVPIPPVGDLGAGSELQAIAYGRCVLLTVWRDQHTVLTFGVADNGRCGVRLWEELIESAEPSLPNRRHLERPQTPWAASHPAGYVREKWQLSEARTFGLLLPALAWAWLAQCDRRGEPRDPPTFQRGVAKG
jgi:hypothetical protein